MTEDISDDQPLPSAEFQLYQGTKIVVHAWKELKARGGFKHLPRTTAAFDELAKALEDYEKAEGIEGA